MPENLNEWVGENVWAVWLGLGLLLGTAEMLTMDFTLLMLAGGALAGAGVAFLFPGAWVVQVLVACAVAVSLLFVLRPTLIRRTRNAPGYRSSLSKLVGSEGTALTAIGRGRPGEVKVDGQVWSARVFGDQSVAAGDTIEVYEVDGTNLIVYPTDRALP